jgi:hypothetical protein
VRDRAVRKVFEHRNEHASQCAAIASIAAKITHARDYLSSGTDHIKVESLAPRKAPLPITETGYRSHFVPALELVNAGGPVTFVSAWLEREAAGKAWRVKAAAAAQADLFQWADAQLEVGKRKRKPAAVTPRAHTARMAHDQALGKVMQSLLKDDTQVYKQFVENESFRRFVTDMVFGMTQEPPPS